MTTTEVISIGASGFSCQNINQPNGMQYCNGPDCPCSNYEARFCCDHEEVKSKFVLYFSHIPLI